ncbi:SIMPL domain-containing protein [bacterium]|nr:SIMPL domain-containing protein [bacterium]MCI0565566.1 SIMPL domain-containing protein [bacterium]
MEETNKNNPKAILFQAGALLCLVLAVLVAMKFISEIKAYGYIGSDIESRETISVSAEGEAFAIPDIAEFTVSFTHEAVTVAEAQAKVTEKMNEIIAAVKENGVEDKDIQTTHYNIYPRYEYGQQTCPDFRYPCEPGERILKGYEVSHGIKVKVRETEKAGDILSGAGSLGATDVSGLTFAVDDEDKVLREARKDAIDKAKEKARLLAKDLGVDLGRITSFIEGGGPVFYRDFGKMEMAADMAMGAGDAPAPEIPVGENRIVANVTITYEIR